MSKFSLGYTVWFLDSSDPDDPVFSATVTSIREDYIGTECGMFTEDQLYATEEEARAALAPANVRYKPGDTVWFLITDGPPNPVFKATVTGILRDDVATNCGTFKKDQLFATEAEARAAIDPANATYKPGDTVWYTDFGLPQEGSVRYAMRIGKNMQYRLDYGPYVLTKPESCLFPDKKAAVEYLLSSLRKDLQDYLEQHKTRLKEYRDKFKVLNELRKEEE